MQIGKYSTEAGDTDYRRRILAPARTPLRPVLGLHKLPTKTRLKFLRILTRRETPNIPPAVLACERVAQRRK